MRSEIPTLRNSQDLRTSQPARNFDCFGVQRIIFRILMAATVILALSIPVGGIVFGQSVDDLASDFSVVTMDGKKFTLSQQRGKILVYFFSFPG